MPWLELRIISDREQAPIWETRLSQAGSLAITLQDNADQPIFEPALGETPLWQDTRVTGLFDADVVTNHIEQQLQLNGPPYKDLQWRWHLVEDKDWEREWMQHFHPIHCANDLWICPSWLAPPKPDAVNLLLDPGLAFGTGTHPTTFLCLQWIAQQDMANKSVIDYGCGSGILGIASLLLGAKQVIGVDIDPQALLSTGENAERNNIDRDRFPVFFPDKAPKKIVDIVLANILAGPLCALADTLSSHVSPGGYLCLSGILAEQAQTVIEHYTPHFDDLQVQQKEDWVCITGQKRSERGA